MPRAQAQSFHLHPQLERDTLFIMDMKLCRALLMNNAWFPWLILVPRLTGVREIIDLSKTQQHRLTDEIAQVSKVMRKLFTCDKLNVAALGNQVPQLHVHVIARTQSDAAWPNPVWGKGGEPYANPKKLLAQLMKAL